MKSKNELAQFCPSWLPIAPNARHWDPRAAGFPAIHASSPVNPVNPVNPVQKFLSCASAEVCVCLRLILRSLPAIALVQAG